MARDKHRGGPPRSAPLQPRAVSKARVAAVCAALVIAVLAAFGGLLSAGFITYDDKDYVTENPHVQDGLTGRSVLWAFTSTEACNWHPLTWLSHMLDVQLFGMDAGAHHRTNVALHAVNAVLLFLLLFRMTGALWRSAFVAALFALHPLHVESVAWIAERKDVLSTLFWLLTTGAWLAYVKSKKASLYALMLALFALGLMAKPMLVTVPFTLLLLDFWPLRRLEFPLRGGDATWRGLLLEKAPLFAMSAASCVITFIAQRSGGAVKAAAQFPPVQRVANAALAYTAYLGKTLWPDALAIHYPYPYGGPAILPAVSAFLVLAVVTALVVRMAGRLPYLAFGWLWYLGTLVPVIGLVQVGFQARADRYTYMPLLGIFAAVSWGLAEIAGKSRTARRAVPAAAAVALAALLAVSRIQTGYWADNGTLFAHAIAVTKDNDMARYQLGLSLFDQGRMEEAVPQFTEALRIDPRMGEARNNLGIALYQLRRWPEAAEQFREALKFGSAHVQALNNLGLTLVQMGRTGEALERFQDAVRMDPEFMEARMNAGNALAGAGRLEEAAAQFREALRTSPDSLPALSSLGRAFLKMNRLTEAAECLRKVVRLRPDDIEAQNNLGAVLAKTGQNEEAAEHYRQALALQPDSAVTLDNLGLVLMRMNRTAEAAESFGKASVAAPGSAGIRFHLGMALAAEGRPGEARGQFQAALQIKPDFKEARTALQNLPGQ
jgi:protein O-mannosyl-transferase